MSIITNHLCFYSKLASEVPKAGAVKEQQTGWSDLRYWFSHYAHCVDPPQPPMPGSGPSDMRPWTRSSSIFLCRLSTGRLEKAE